MNQNDILYKAAHILPSPRQYDWMNLELTAFLHFSLNTYYDREWGDGKEDPQRFNPENCEPREWIRLLAECGFKLAILTCKHHGGFCLWPSAYTDYSVKSSPWKNGEGDLVREVALACNEFGVKFGVYLSPWDRHEKSYTDSPVYNRYFLNQLRELLTGYGKVACVWFDGARVPVNGRTQEYAWDEYYALIRELQPEALISCVGPDIRWCGNEEGKPRKAEWAVVNVNQPLPQFNTENYKREDVGEPGDGRNLRWYPSEVDTSIRPNWFYHQNDNGEVKSLRKLFDIYCNSVGHNAVLLLNLPPDPQGRICEVDAGRLREFAAFLKEGYAVNFMENATLRKPSENESVFQLKNPATFNTLVLQEDILRHGQRVESYAVDINEMGAWRNIATGCTIGRKEIVRFPEVTSDSLRVRITNCRWQPELLQPGIFRFPEIVEEGKSCCDEVSVAEIDLTASSADERFPVQNLKNGEAWFSRAGESLPQWIMAELTHPHRIRGFFILPNPKTSSGLIRDWQCEVSTDAEHWQVIAQGEFQNLENNPIFQKVYFENKIENIRFVRVKAVSTYDGTSVISLEKFGIIAEPQEE